MCFSLVTLSFEIQPREAIPVEIKTDTRGFDSNSALSLARCLPGAGCCGTGPAGPVAAVCSPARGPRLGWGVGAAARHLRSLGGRGSFDPVCFSPEEALEAPKERKQAPRSGALDAGGLRRAVGSFSHELSNCHVIGPDPLIPGGATLLSKF